MAARLGAISRVGQYCYVVQFVQGLLTLTYHSTYVAAALTRMMSTVPARVIIGHKRACHSSPRDDSIVDLVTQSNVVAVVPCRTVAWNSGARPNSNGFGSDGYPNSRGMRLPSHLIEVCESECSRNDSWMIATIQFRAGYGCRRDQN